MMRGLILIFAIATLASPAQAAAQSREGFGTIYYGISAGVGERSVTGALPATLLPTSASQPPSRAIGVLDLEGGLGVARRVALVGIFDKGASFKDANRWGSLALDAVVRAWIDPHAWVEGGLSVTELAFAPSACPASPAACSQANFWHAGFEAGGGYELFHGPTVTVHVLARYSQATFDGLRQRAFTVQMGLLGRH